MKRKKTNNKNVYKKNVVIHRKTINTNKSDCEKNYKLIHVFVTMRFNNVLPVIHEKKILNFPFVYFQLTSENCITMKMKEMEVECMKLVE